MKELKKIKAAGMFLAGAVLVCVTGITGLAQTDKRSANIKSKGIISFENGTAVIDASDFTYLADEIDLLEDTYKTETVNALNQIGTYYNLDGTTTFNKDESTLSSANASILPFSAIINGVINSQSIPTERTYLGILPGETIETSGNISAATAANLSLGTAAWVDGELIVGTGADNNSYYALGYSDGYAEKVDNLSISYTYHQHTGNASEGGGCYTNGVHNHTSSCSYTYGTHHVVTTDHYDGGNVYMKCTYCGAGGYSYNDWHTGDWGSCKARLEYTCGGIPIQYYTLGCGKTESTIETAIIVFN